MNKYFIDVQKDHISMLEMQNGKYEPIHTVKGRAGIKTADVFSEFLPTLPDQDAVNAALVKMLEDM